jgi:hypothetical protein
MVGTVTTVMAPHVDDAKEINRLLRLHADSKVLTTLQRF